MAESFFSSLKKKNGSENAYKNRDLARRISSITLKCSTTGPRRHSHLGGVSPRPSNRPRREDRNCLPERGQSTTTRMSSSGLMANIHRNHSSGLRRLVNSGGVITEEDGWLHRCEFKPLQGQYQYSGALRRSGEYCKYPTGAGVYDQNSTKEGMPLFGCNEVPPAHCREDHDKEPESFFYARTP